MTRDDIIRLAREAGWKPLGENPKTEFTFFLDNLKRFAALVSAAEREACAKIAESYEPRCDTCPSGVSSAIRARSNTGIKWEIEP
jgi:hypothetical protein